MDPLGIIASAIGIAAVTAQAATVFVKAITTIKGAHAEIKAVSRDVYAFYAVVSSLKALLQDEEVMNAISSDAAMVGMIENLMNPLQNCQRLLSEIMMKMRKRCDLTGERRTRQISSTSLRWGLCTKNQMRDLQLQLDATKSTLCGALSVISILCSVRQLTLLNGGASSSGVGSSSTHSLCMRLSTSFDYPLASTPAEQYTTQGLLSERIFVTVMKKSLVDPQTQTYFLNYAETTRLWRRVIVVATFKGMKGVSTVSSIQATDNTEDVAIVLPNAVHNLLSQLLLRTPLHRSVSRLSLTLKEDENGKLCHEAPEVGLARNLVERESVAEERILRELPDMSCPTFVESEVAVESRVSSMSYNAIVRGDRCIERKAPFATAGIDDENGFQTFLDDLKINIALRDCPGVARFIGVVLDDTRSQLRSYLYESPIVFRLSRIFIIANAESEIVPWELRELWAQQIVGAVSEIHRRGLSLGGIDIESVGVRNDGTALLTRLHTSLSERQATKGLVPPEMRRGFCDGHNTQKPPLNNYRANIFQLGHVLWLLAEHRVL